MVHGSRLVPGEWRAAGSDASLASSTWATPWRFQHTTDCPSRSATGETARTAIGVVVQVVYWCCVHKSSHRSQAENQSFDLGWVSVSSLVGWFGTVSGFRFRESSDLGSVSASLCSLMKSVSSELRLELGFSESLLLDDMLEARLDAHLLGEVTLFIVRTRAVWVDLGGRSVYGICHPCT